MFLMDKHLEVLKLATQYSIQLSQLPQQRILLATHTNSAADLCIVKRLDKYVQAHTSKEGKTECKMLRIVAPSRFASTIPPEVIKYCKMDARRNSFVIPSTEEVLSAQLVIVTTSCSSSLLRNRQLYGQFTHIFLDEAAQSYEPEAIIPLVLAKPQTVIFLAGYLS